MEPRELLALPGMEEASLFAAGDSTPMQTGGIDWRFRLYYVVKATDVAQVLLRLIEEDGDEDAQEVWIALGEFLAYLQLAAVR